ncbi:hypothetical protein BASA81_000489 [Batrachochytrium salamandrivorans]|nr:hypothetical protein BASA81_000489 [Batrachochytrium salamandrivorans]
MMDTKVIRPSERTRDTAMSSRFSGSSLARGGPHSWYRPLRAWPPACRPHGPEAPRTPLLLRARASSHGHKHAWPSAVYGPQPSKRQIPTTNFLMRLLLGLICLWGVALVHAKRLGGKGWSIYVLQSDGSVYAVGNNQFGQLGTGSTATSVYSPVKMSGVTNAVDISAAWSSACVVLATGQVKCMGDNEYHNIGDGTVVDRLVPTAVTGLTSGASEVFVGSGVSCAVLTTGGARCWGEDDYGALMAGTKTSAPIPGPVTGYATSGVQQISMGDFHACLLTTTGKVLCAGLNSSGQLGDGTAVNRQVPTKVMGLANLATNKFVSISCGDYSTCASTTTGSVVCWGSDDYGQLGDGKTAFTVKLPVQVKTLTAGTTRSVWGGESCSFAVQMDGTVKAFGRNTNGILGNGNTASQSTPVVFAPGAAVGVVEITGGGVTACVLLSTGEVKCLGLNSNGQMGVGSGVGSSLTLLKMNGLPSPQPIASPTVPLPPTSLAPSKKPTKAPTVKPTKAVTKAPTKKPTKAPTAKPIPGATKAPTARPSKVATKAPTKKPTKAPTAKPIAGVTKAPTKKPTKAPTVKPTKAVTKAPTKKPTKAPTSRPTKKPVAGR